jgi:hypothetical protein
MCDLLRGLQLRNKIGRIEFGDNVPEGLLVRVPLRTYFLVSVLQMTGDFVDNFSFPLGPEM